jgi:multidrug efflux pump subunit AcrB
VSHRTDEQLIAETHNTSRYFVEQKHVAWILLLFTLLWGIYGYFQMPQRKDPDIPVRQALAIASWPGASPEKMEQLVTRKIEEQVGQNTKVHEIKSVTRGGTAFVYVTLDERVGETGKEFDDIKLKLDSIRLPAGALPVQFVKDFGDTAALMLTVASPRVDAVDLDLRERDIRSTLEAVRAGANGRSSIVLMFPRTFQAAEGRRRVLMMFRDELEASKIAQKVQIVEGTGFAGVDGITSATDEQLAETTARFIKGRLQQSEFHPDIWGVIAVRDLKQIRPKLDDLAGDKYTYRELDDFTDKIEKSLKSIPEVSKVTRSGVLAEQIHLLYSQERLAAYGITPAGLSNTLDARNIALPGGVVNANGRNVPLQPSGEFRRESEIGNVVVSQTSTGLPVYLRDLVQIERGYESPAQFLNYYTYKDEAGKWRRARAITLDVQMRAGEQIDTFGRQVDANLTDLSRRLPADLVIARTSDQPQQVEEQVDLLMSSLWEAVGLVVIVSLIGFWEWRSAVLMALSIPITLAMTFGMMQILGIDLQQVSIATLIIALGLLVDDPVVAGDAIKRSLAEGQSRANAAWLGPTKLATAILFATITNIVAYLPFLLLPGDTGRFIYSLPVVITCSLVASRIASMTFVPLLGYYLLRPKREPAIEERRQTGFAARYYRLGAWAIDHRWGVLATSCLIFVAGAFFASQLKPQFFPQDLQYLSYVDVWLPEDSSASATAEAAATAEQLIRKTTSEHGGESTLISLTSWIGGGGPRFWFSSAPEPRQLNYAQILIQVRDKHATDHLVPELQRALTGGVPNARVDVRKLESGAPVGIPVSIRVSGEDIPLLRIQAEKLKSILRSSALAERVRDDWGEESLAIDLNIDPDRAILSGVSNQDVAYAAATGLSGYAVATLREGDKNIPIVSRMAMSERARISDIENLYVYSTRDNTRVPLRQVATVEYKPQLSKISRLNQYRTITVSAFPTAASLPSEVLGSVMPQVREWAAALPPGTRMEIAGEYKEQQKGFGNLAVVMGISVLAIFLALVVQFKHAVKPLVVFSAIPYGIVGAMAALWVMDAPFGFMAFLGIASLVGVIVSHVIVLFDFIEERHQQGEPLREALLDAGILRLRPVLITVGATVIALFPLAAHGGPLWEPLCYAQIGGLTFSTLITLLLVPVVYAIFVLDLKWIRWEKPSQQEQVPAGSVGAMTVHP